jgi:hypothetical protein
MAIEFRRGAFENPDNPLDSADVDAAIVVVVRASDRPAVHSALERCLDRWWYIDGAGHHHTPEDEFWDAQPDAEGSEWHSAKYVSDVTTTDAGVKVHIDIQSFMPAAMRAAYRRVLVEELEAAGIRDATVQSQSTEHHAPLVTLPGGSWPPYQDAPVPGLPEGVPPGQLLHHELRKTRNVRVSSQRKFAEAWKAKAMAAIDRDDVPAVREIVDVFENAKWRVSDPVSTAEQNWAQVVGMPRVYSSGDPLIAAGAVTDHAAARITCKSAHLLRDQGWSVPTEAVGIATISAYYEITG